MESLAELLQGTKGSSRGTAEQLERIFDPVLKTQEAYKYS
jgi:hypothetical protein